MKKILVKSIKAENFKKFKAISINFGEKTTAIFGKNFRGKSSVADAFSWVLFNKSSTGNAEGSQFRPRRYDENGNNIDHVDVMAELVLLVDGEELKIKKVQRQNWVRHHGEDFESYAGDTTEYFWNDVPVKATDHKKKVEEIISEKLFRMLTNPAAFPSLPAKEQREFLLTNVANITDADVFASNPDFAPLQSAMGAKTLEELTASNKNEISGYKKLMDELPIRIDQESKRIEEIDFSEAESEFSKLQADLATNEADIENTASAYEKINQLREEKAKVDGELKEVERCISDVHTKAYQAKQREENHLSNKLTQLSNEKSGLETNVAVTTANIEGSEKVLSELRKKYTDEMSKELSSDAKVCPTCGQEMPTEQIERIKAEFSKKKADSLENLKQQGDIVNANLEQMKESINKAKDRIVKIDIEMSSISAYREVAKGELAKLGSDGINYADDAAWVELKAKSDSLANEIAAINTDEADNLKAALKEKRVAIQTDIDRVKEKLVLKGVIEKAKETVEELRKELINVAQSLAECEKLESLINKFSRAKMDMLSERINDKFKLIKWKLFELQKNQKYAEVCVCMIHGSQYGENTTSATERMMAGMDIINTLQEIYGVNAPIFLDDADLYNDENIPAMNAQLVKLCVSDDEELRVVQE